jgi:energy-coupling factor transporter transmembrane protein EcfT
MKKFVNKCKQLFGPVGKDFLNVFKTLFGYSIMLTLLGGGLTMLCYVVALIIGGDVAAKICEVTYKQVWPVIIMIANITIILGLLAMYINGDKALSPSEKKKKLTKKGDSEGTDD